MLVKEFVQAILDEILFLQDDSDKIDVFVKLESRLSFDKLKVFLNNFLNNSDTLSITYINRFADFLSKRWQNIKDTDASYLYNQHTLANRATIYLAKCMNNFVEPNSGALYYYFFLMPTLGSSVPLDIFAIQDSNYKMNSSFGDPGRYILAKYILSFIKQLKEFIDLFKNINPKQWKEFISYVDTEDLDRILLKGHVFIDAVRDKRLYTENEAIDRGIFFAFAEFYIRQRSQAKKFTNTYGYFTVKSQKIFGDYSHYICGYSREDKLESVMSLQDFLISNLALNQLENYFNEPERKKLKGPLFELEIFSELGTLAQQIQNYNMQCNHKTLAPPVY